MRNVILFVIVFCVAGCNSNEEKKTSALETVLKKTTGIDTDLNNLNNSEKNKAEIDIADDGLNLKERFKNGFATITAAKEVISLTITNEENGQDHILIGFTGTDLTQMRPIKGRMNTNGENSMSFSTANYKNNEADMMMAFDVEGEIISLKPEKNRHQAQRKYRIYGRCPTPRKMESI
ncbi:MAG: hypothetical protein KL787_08575 [Taibaiella sp.]|nr:hypothetical protein [Taibaiella sp.]